ncbi:O-antigen ligase family protein [Patescibacteria group bacterium]|nr:O-antigen ligase family protein [Patescibacteria group bacterium]
MKQLEKLTSKRLNSLFKYIGATILIFTPLYPKFPLFFLPFSTVAIRAEDLLIATAIFILILVYKKNLQKNLPPITYQILVYWGVGLLSVASAILITQNVNPLLTILHFLRRVEYMSLFFMFYYLGSIGKKNRRFFLKMLLLPVIGVFIYGIAQIYFRAPVISTMNAEFSKGVALTLQPGVQLSSTFSGHYDLAVYLTFIISILFAMAVHTNKKHKLGAIFLSTLPLIWLFSKAGSRMGLLGLLGAISAISLVRKKFFLGFIMLFLIGLGALSSPHLVGRFSSFIKVFAVEEVLRPIQQDRSTSIRIDVEWPRAIRSFYKNPFLGTGYSSLGLATDNDYLRSLGETGMLGLLSFIAVLIALVKSIFSRLKKATNTTDKTLVIASIGVFTAMTVIAVFIDTFEASKIAIMFWSIMGLSLSTKS